MSLTSDDVLNFLRESLGVDEPIGAETALFSNGLLDSVAMINLIGFVEERGKFEMRASDVNLSNLDSAERIAAYVDARG